MGVIQNERPLDHHRCLSSISEETLYIASEDDRESVASVRPLSRRKTTKSHAHIKRDPSVTLKADWGKKKSRRYHNVCSLVTLVEEEELDKITIEDFVECTKSPFSILLETKNGLQKWEEFVTSSEDVQNSILTGSKPEIKKPEHEVKARLNPTLRQLVKKRSLPLGMLEYLEQQLVAFFLAMPREVYISPELSSFERLLLHSVSDYHSLVSLSFNKDRVRLVRVNNPRDNYFEPSVLLTNYLQTVYNIS